MPESTNPSAPYTASVELIRTWGQAENGDVYEVALRPHLLDELHRRWPPLGLTRHAEQPHGPVVARIGLSDKWVIVPDVEESGDEPPLLAWDQLEQSLTVFTAHRLERTVAVHAAVFALDGSCVVVPASSDGGKSTLTVAAARAGATVLSDEYTLIDPTTGMVTGWHRPVRIRRGGGSVDRLPLAVRHDPVPVALLAVLDYHPGGRTTFAPISQAEAVGHILAHTLCARIRPDDAFDAAVAVARVATALAGPRGEADATIDELRRLSRREAGFEQ